MFTLKIYVHQLTDGGCHNWTTTIWTGHSKTSKSFTSFSLLMIVIIFFDELLTHSQMGRVGYGVGYLRLGCRIPKGWGKVR